MNLIVKNKIINGDLKTILEKLKIEAHKPYLFKDIKISGDSLMTNCPLHEDNKPSCGFVNTRVGKSEWGKCHCFSCQQVLSLPQLVSYVFGASIEFAEDWLVKNFGGDAILIDELPVIDLNNNIKKETFLDESILTKYDYYHPYMWERKLSREVVDKYRIGFDPVRKCLTFPVWDLKDRLKLITTRSVNTKQFYITKEQDKPVYLLNFILKENPPAVMITEAQIDALTAMSYGFPCCATIGSISFDQIKILNKSGIRTFVAAFDNDKWGDKFYETFKSKMKNDILVYKFEFPKDKKDINDLSKEEFWSSLNKLGFFME